MKDIIISVADSYQENVLKALLPRVPVASQTIDFTYDIIINAGHDAGSYNDSHELLRPSINQYRYAIVLLDFEGTGVEQKSVKEIEDDIQNLLDKNGWLGRNCAVVIRPELENWMWVEKPQVEDAIGWEKRESLYEWAKKEGYIANGESKPARPKETFETALRVSGTPKSAAIYKKIASTVSYKYCTDSALNKLICQLQLWFPRV